MELRKAVECDTKGNHRQAIQLYEEVLRSTDPVPIDVYINLAFLYWKYATQLPFLPDVVEELGQAGTERFPVILEQGLSKFPNSPELHFWEKYFPYRALFQEFTREECEAIVRKYGDPQSIIPYFFLWLFDKVKYSEKRGLLLKQCDELPTAKNRYIKSVLETNA